MKHAKLLVALFAALGIAAIVPELSAALSASTFDTVLILLGWLFPLAMGVIAIARPPFEAWQGVTALAGFALVAIKLRTWDALPHFAALSHALQLAHVAIVGGAIVSAIAAVRPERA